MVIPNVSSTVGVIKRVGHLEGGCWALLLLGLVTPSLDNTLEEKHRQLDAIWNRITGLVWELEIISHEEWMKGLVKFSIVRI